VPQKQKMPRFTEITYRNKKSTETDLQYIEYKLRRVKQLQSRQEWLLRNKEKIKEYMKKNKELEDEIFNFYITSLANETIDQTSFTNLIREIHNDEFRTTMQTQQIKHE
jgi:hypothetical protein